LTLQSVTVSLTISDKEETIMAARSGSPEYITKSWNDGGRERHGYIVLVNVPGDDTYEVGLSSLRKHLGLHRLTPQQAQVLTSNKPGSITFTGTCHESSYGSYNNLDISRESAAEWADMVKGLV
jgi:hypothetical protein